jgi:DNA-binding XRE family transcriptional regulator
MTRQGKLFDETGRLLERKTLTEIDEWLRSAPAEWRDRLRYFIACGVPKDKAFIPAWWSLPKDARKAGHLGTLSDLANWLGVSRETLDKWENQKYGDPPATLRDLGKFARIRRMSELGPDVDMALIAQLESGDASAGHFKLYYDITSITQNESILHMVGVGDGPIQIRRADELSDDELAAIAAGSGVAADSDIAATSCGRITETTTGA